MSIFTRLLLLALAGGCILLARKADAYHEKPQSAASIKLR